MYFLLLVLSLVTLDFILLVLRLVIMWFLSAEIDKKNLEIDHEFNPLEQQLEQHMEKLRSNQEITIKQEVGRLPEETNQLFDTVLFGFYDISFFIIILLFIFVLLFYFIKKRKKRNKNKFKF
jgi:predicted PurR-regulated permease PerM